MGGRDWHRLENIDRGRLREARLQAHYAAQWLGRVGGAFVPPEEDYSHTSMGWNETLACFATNELKGGMRLGLSLADLTFVVLGRNNERTSSCPLNRRADKDAQKWLEEQLGAVGLEAGLLGKTTPYEIPPHAIAKGGAYGTNGVTEALGQLAAWFGNAHSALGAVRKQMTGWAFSVSPVRCWPHHFDLATLISLDESGGEHGRSVNAGLSPGDEYYDEPYFYVTPYPHPDASTLPPLTPLGHWHRRDFTAAIAPATRVIDGKDQRAGVEVFLKDAVEKAIKILG